MIRLKLSITLPPMSFTIRGRTIKVDGDELALEGFTEEEANAIKTSIEDNFWEYDVSKRAAGRATWDEAFMKAVEAIHGPRFAREFSSQVEQGKICFAADDDTVLILFKDSSLAGRFIGRGGARIRLLEEALGVRIKIVSNEGRGAGEHEELRRKLHDLLNSLVP
jgi:hypothetical protein